MNILLYIAPVLLHLKLGEPVYPLLHLIYHLQFVLEARGHHVPALLPPVVKVSYPLLTQLYIPQPISYLENQSEIRFFDIVNLDNQCEHFKI